MRKFAASVAALLHAVAALASEAPIAITESRIVGPNGAIRHVQLMRLPAGTSAADCQAVLAAAREIPRRSVVERQACEPRLPVNLAPIEKGLAVADGYAISYVDRIPGFPSLPVVDIYFYEFNPGTPAEVRARALARYRQRDSNAECRPPAGS